MNKVQKKYHVYYGQLPSVETVEVWAFTIEDAIRLSREMRSGMNMSGEITKAEMIKTIPGETANE